MCGEKEVTKYCFGTNIPVIGGDSGSPVVNENFELEGLVRAYAMGVFSYINKIENFVNYKPLVKQKIDVKKD